MEIQRGSDVVILLKLTDIEGLPMRVADCSQFKIKVWTQNPNNHLVYHKRDIVSEMPPTEMPPKPRKKPSNHLEIPPMPPIGYDRLPIAAQDLNCLESGILVYSYSYAKPNSDFAATDNYYDKVKTVVTDIYWRNTNLNQEPSNPVSFYTIEHLKDMIEEERLVRNHDIEEIRTYIDEEYTNKLEDEIRRSTDVDIAFHNLIKTNKEECDAANTAIGERVDALEAVVNGNNSSLTDTIAETAANLANEVSRSTAKDAEHDAAISAEVARAKSEETRIEGKLDTEIARAKAAEQTFYDLVDSEKTRAKAAEETLTNSLNTTNATVQTLSDSLTAEVARSNAKDLEHTTEVSRLESKIDTNSGNITTEVARAKAVEADITTQLSTLKTDYLETKGKAIANETAIAVLNGDDSTVGSVAHAQADANHYTDDAINALRTEINSATNTSLADYATKAEVEQSIKKVIGTAPEALDTLGEIADALNNDSDAITAINGVLSGKANSSDVYTKTQIDTKETALNNAISTTNTNLANEASRATNAETTISGNLTNEIARATAKEADIETELQNLKSTVLSNGGDLSALENTVATHTTNIADLGSDIADLKTADTTINGKVQDNATAIANETTRATNAESSLSTEIANVQTAIGVINGNADVVGSIAHAKADSEHYTDDKIAALKTEINTSTNDSLSLYATKAEVDGRIEGIIGTAPAALDTLGEIADRLSVDNDAINAINSVLSGKANATDVYTKAEVDAKETAINNNVSTVQSNLANEVTRATTAETAIAGDLASEIARAKGVEADITTNVTTLKTDYLVTQSKAIANETAISVLNGDDSVVGSVEHAKADANHYTDDAINSLRTEISTATNTTLADYATKADVDGRIADVIGAAPAALDTLGEIADKLSEDGIAIAAINSVLSGKANSADVYTKSEIDSKETAINNSISAINASVQNVENAIGVINGNESTIGSIKHCLDDSKHYTDDAIAAATATIPTKVANEVAAHLNEYAKVAETTVIKDADGVVITEMIVDNNATDNTIEVYTRAQCDEKFALKSDVVNSGSGAVDSYTKAEVNNLLSNKVEKVSGKGLSTNDFTTAEKNKLAAMPTIWSGTQAEFDAIATKDNNTIYFVKE